jgi:hypothetical protein
MPHFEGKWLNDLAKGMVLRNQRAKKTRRNPAWRAIRTRVRSNE